MPTALALDNILTLMTAPSRIIIHVGAEKTGSSAIQYCLRHIQDQLHAKGFHFAKSPGEMNNRELASCCIDTGFDDDQLVSLGITDQPSLEAFRASVTNSLHEEISSLPSYIHTIIASSEHFHSRLRTHSSIIKLKEIFEIYKSETTVSFYVREQAAMCESFYSTVLKAGGLERWAHHAAKCTPANGYYNHLETYRLWESIFGATSIVTRVHQERPHSPCYNAVDDFLVNTLKEPELVTFIHSVRGETRTNNQSLTPEGIETMHALNTIFLAMSKDTPLRSLRQQVAANISSRMRGQSCLMSGDEYKQIYDSFKRSNAELRQACLNEIDSDLFPYLPPGNMSKPFAGPATSAIGHDQHVSAELAALILEIFAETVENISRSKSSKVAKALIDLSVKVDKWSTDAALDLVTLSLGINPDSARGQRRFYSLRKFLNAYHNAG